MTQHQPEWAEVADSVGAETLGVYLSGKQRDYLASYPPETVVVLVQQDMDNGAVRICANGELYEEGRWITVPWEGFLTQPDVQLSDPEVPDHAPEP